MTCILKNCLILFIGSLPRHFQEPKTNIFKFKIILLLLLSVHKSFIYTLFTFYAVYIYFKLSMKKYSCNCVDECRMSVMCTNLLKLLKQLAYE